MNEIKRIRSADGGRAVLVDIESVNGNGETEKVSYLLLPEQYRELEPHRGPADDEAVERIRAASELCRALRHGRYLLSFGANSEKTLVTKLRRKGYSAAASTGAAAMLCAAGDIDENADAVRLAELCVKKGEGRSRIRARLSAKGFSDGAAAAAEEYMSGVDFTGVCRRVIENKWQGGLPREPEERRRAVAALCRLGFSLTEIKNAERQ